MHQPLELSIIIKFSGIDKEMEVQKIIMASIAASLWQALFNAGWILKHTVRAAYIHHSAGFASCLSMHLGDTFPCVALATPEFINRVLESGRTCLPQTLQS